MTDLRALAAAELLPASIPEDTRLTLITLALDDPLAYIFESADWQAAIGAARLIHEAADQLRAALPAGRLLLAGLDGQSHWIALVRDLPPDWAAIVRIAPEMTGVLTASAAGLSLTARQVFQGLYRTPTTIIGIPGMATHQARVNHYYGVADGVTLPNADQIASRRHFGEALTLIDHLISRARTDREYFPFYECLPVVERCTICRSRPAESESTGILLCGICRRKRQAAGASRQPPRTLAIIGARAIGVDGRPVEAILRQSPTPAAYLQLTRALIGTWAAIDREADRSLPATPIWRSEAESWWIVPAAQALTFTATVGKKFTAAVAGWPDDVARLTVQIGAGFDHQLSDRSPDRSDWAGAALTCQSAAAAIAQFNAATVRSPLKPGIILDAGRVWDQPPLRYSPDAALQLQSAVDALHREHFPTAAFADLPRQLARRTTGLYYDSVRNRLDDRARKTIDAIVIGYENHWGKATEPFFSALNDTISIAAAIAHE